MFRVLREAGLQENAREDKLKAEREEQRRRALTSKENEREERVAERRTQS
jgi:hypothetical protein